MTSRLVSEPTLIIYLMVAKTLASNCLVGQAFSPNFYQSTTTPKQKHGTMP